MASEFQRDKVLRVFDAMDVDEDGMLMATDFAALGDRWARVRGPGDHDLLREIMHGWWTTLSTAAGGAEAVTVDDVLAVVDLLGTMPEAVTGTAEAMFRAIDRDGDGRVSGEEYNELIEAWNGHPTETGAVFALLDLNGDGHLSAAEFTALWTEFWAGDDPGSPGSWVFGH